MRNWLLAVLLSASALCLPAHAQTVTYVHTDALGSPVVETDANRNVVERNEYEPYGRTNQPLDDGPGYTGHVGDAATGLIYAQQRYYDDDIGRFLSVDPVSAYEQPVTNFNRYVYAVNNPYRFTDPDGRQSHNACVLNPANARVCAEAGMATGSEAAGAASGSSGSGSGGILAGILTAIGLDRLIQSADTADSASDKIREGTGPAQGASGKKGELEGQGGQAGADDAFDSVDGANERSPREGVRVKDLEGGGRIETHGATKNPDYPQGTPTVKVQDANGKPVTTVRYPEPKR